MSLPTALESRIADAPVSAHLATSIDDRPHVAPVWYGYRDGVLYFITGGKKLSNVRRNPRVSISIESANDGDVEWNATLLGMATVRDDPERIEWASNWIYDKYDGDGGETDTIDDETTSADESDDPSRSDGGESEEGERGRALVEVSFGSASMNTYE